jgi:carboxyl-terminal processing protease
VAGALKDHQRAVLIGEKTYGKGVVQQRFSLENGSIT